MAVKTKSERFVLAKKEQWVQLNYILTKINTAGFRALRDDEIKAFPRLFRLTCADLAEAKMLQLSPDVLDYLNQLVGQAHKFLYSFPPVKTTQIRSFFTRQLPFILLKNWPFILLSAFLFFSTYALSFALVSRNPSSASLVVPTSVLNEMEDSYRSENDEESSMTHKNFAVTFYIHNNVSIAFACFALGVFFGLGTIYILIYNGIVLGAITGYIVALGYKDNLFNFITAHSVAELSGLVFSGAAGLALGFAIVKATRYYRKEWLALQRHNIFTLVAASAILLLLAATIEGNVSPSLLPYTLKMTVAVITGVGIFGYFLLWPGIRIILNRSGKGHRDEFQY